MIGVIVKFRQANQQALLPKNKEQADLCKHQHRNNRWPLRRRGGAATRDCPVMPARERVLPGLDCSYLLMQRKVLKVHELLNILASHYSGLDHSLAEPPARKFWMCLATKCVATAVSRA